MQLHFACLPRRVGPFLLILVASLMLAAAPARPVAAAAQTSQPASEPPLHTVYLPLINQGGAPVANHEQPDFPSYAAFAASVSNEQAGVVRGVYVPAVLALRVIQQPAGNAAYVSDEAGVVTQFQTPALFGVTGLLAHNTLAGMQFLNLALGQEVHVIYGDGADHRYVVTQLYRFQALEPTNPASAFVDLSTSTVLTAAGVFEQVYTGGEHVTFQTCIDRDGQSSWGRLFVVAMPLN
jgi:hypothetical protein